MDFRFLCCFVLLFFVDDTIRRSGVFALSVVNGTYYDQDNIFIGTAESQIVVRLDFDDEAYVARTCPPPSVDPPQVIPCCLPGQDPTVVDCYQPPIPDYTCLDNFTSIHEQFSYFNSNVTRPSYKVAWKIKNPNTCTGFGLSTVDFVGHSQYTVNIGPSYFQYFYGYPPLFLCCYDVRAAVSGSPSNPFWDGGIALIIDSHLYFDPEDHKTRFQVIFETNITKLPIKHFFNQAQINFLDSSDLQRVLVKIDDCQGNLLGRVTLMNRKCIFLYPPREDAIYWFFKSVTYAEIPPVLDNMLLFVYRKVVKDYNKENAVYNILNSYTIELTNVVDKDGNMLTNPVVNLTYHFVPGYSCSYSSFQPLFDEFVKALGDFSLPQNFSIFSFKTLRDYFYDSVKAPTMSLHWQGCKYHVANFLLSPTQEAKGITTKECLKTYGTLDFAVDPCCNETLTYTMCCIQRPVQQTLNKYSPVLLDAQNSLAPICSQDSLIQFNALSYASLNDLNAKCPQIPQINQFGNVYMAGKTENTLYNRCGFTLGRMTLCDDGQGPRMCMFMTGGDTNAQCVYGPQKVPLTTSWDRTCTIPCKTDADCVFAGGAVTLKCRIHGYYNNCEPLHSPESNFWLSPQALNTIISCVAGFISQFDEKTRFIINKFLGIPFTSQMPTPDSPEKRLLDKALRDFSITQGCTFSYYGILYPDCQKNVKCNWFYATDYDGAQCNFTPEPMNPDGFCGICTNPEDPDTSCVPLSQNGECIFGNEYAQYDLDSWGYQKYPNNSTPFSYVYCYENFHGNIYRHRLGCLAANWTFDETTEVQSINGTLLNVTNSKWNYHGPLRRDGCLNPEFCPVTDRFHDLADGMDHNLIYGETCESYCYWKDANQTTCEMNYFQWLEWTINGNNYSKCIVPGVYYSHCDSYQYFGFSNVLWWQGSTYFPQMYDTEQNCQSRCRYNVNLTESQCISNGHCSNPLCMDCNKEECENSGICDVKPGCYIQYDSSSSCQHYSFDQIPQLAGITLDWFPWGCRVSQYIRVNQITCQFIASVQNVEYFYLPYPEWGIMDKVSCENIGWKYCEIPFTFISRSTTLYYAKDSKFYDSLSPGACAKCGTIPPKTRWYTGQWISSEDQWLKLNWTTRKFVPASNFTDVIDRNKLSIAINNAVISSQIELLKASILCREGNMKDVLLQLSCLCGDDRQNRTVEDCKKTFQTNQTIADTTLCSDLVTDYKFAQMGSFNITQEFKLKNFSCIQLTVSILQQKQFQHDSKTSLSGRLPMPKSQINRGEFQYVSNSKNVVVGKMIGNGANLALKDSTDGELPPPYKGLQACLDLNSLQTTSHETIQSGYYLWVGVSDLTFTKITPIQQSLVLTNHSNSETICFVVESSMIVFPISIQMDDESITYVSTFQQSELGMLIFGLFVYSIVIVLGLFTLGEHVVLHESIKMTKGASEVLAAILISILRIIFWSVILTGAYLSNINMTAIIIFLAELPALILFLTLALIVNKLADVYHSSSKLTSDSVGSVKIIFTGFSIFLIVLLLFAMLFTSFYPSEVINRDCFNPSTEATMSPPDVVALIYLVLFLLAGFVIIACLFFYALSLVRIMTKKQGSRKKSANMLTFVACSASLSLLAQCFFIVVQIVQVWEWSTIAITSYLIIIDLHTLLLLLHYTHNANTTVKTKKKLVLKNDSNAKGSSASGTAKTVTQQQDQQVRSTS